jgi:hypothetical protein
VRPGQLAVHPREGFPGGFGTDKLNLFCGGFEFMNRQQILDCLRDNESALRARGVTHAALFGSRARGDDRSDTGNRRFVSRFGNAIWRYNRPKLHIDV